MSQADLAGIPGRGSTAEVGGSSVRSRLSRGLLLAFCCCHAVFLVICIIPRPPLQNDRGSAAANLYCLLFSGRERWTMFSTIPLQHSLDVWFSREDETGVETTAGCVLPGLKPYPIPEKSRYYILFYQMMFIIDNAPYRNAYFRKASPLLTARPKLGTGGKWSAVTVAGYTRNLFYSRRDGKISTMVPRTFDVTLPEGSNQ